MQNSQKNKTGLLLFKIFAGISKIEKKCRCFGTDTPLYESEIHTIKAIKENSNSHISAIAEKFKKTKGAISQTIKKLEQKGFVEKIINSKNHSKLDLQLTSKGKTAYKKHEEHHKEFDKLLTEMLKCASEKEIKFLNNFLEKLTKNVKNYTNN